MKADAIMLKWIRKRTRRLSAPSDEQPSCLPDVNGNASNQHLHDLTGAIHTWVANSQHGDVMMCPVCRQFKHDVKGDNSCRCDPVQNTPYRKQNGHMLKVSTNLFSSPLSRSRSDVSDLKIIRLTKRLSPRSRAPIVDPTDFAELSSGDETESSGYGGSEYSTTTSLSGYSSDDGSVNHFRTKAMKLKQEMSANSSPIGSTQSPLPKMGCRAVYRSLSVKGRTDTETQRNCVARSNSVNRASRPSCGVRRSRSRASSFRKEGRYEANISPLTYNSTDKGDNSITKGDNNSSSYLEDHINELALIRTELQNMYLLNPAS